MSKKLKRIAKYGTKSEVELFIRTLFIISLFYLLCYELWWYEEPALSLRIERAGVFFSRLFYSILATSIFYYIANHLPVVLPRKERRIKILANVLQKAVYIEWYLSRLRLELGIISDEFFDRDKFLTLLKATKTNDPVSNFPNWFLFLEHLRERIVELTQTMIEHSEHLSSELIQEVLIIQANLLKPGIFEGPPYINAGDLSWAEIQLQEVLIHNNTLQKIRAKEQEKYQKDFDFFGIEYREEHYSEYDKKQAEKANQKGKSQKS